MKKYLSLRTVLIISRLFGNDENMRDGNEFFIRGQAESSNGKFVCPECLQYLCR